MRGDEREKEEGEEEEDEERLDATTSEVLSVQEGVSNM